MSESTIISFCYECGSKEIVKSEFGCDEFYCKNCSQVFFESVSYTLPTHQRIKELEDQIPEIKRLSHAYFDRYCENDRIKSIHKNIVIMRHNEQDHRIKELEDALTFTVNALTNFFPFCGKDINKLPTNLDASQYQTCSYEGDKRLLEKFIECRKLVTMEVE